MPIEIMEKAMCSGCGACYSACPRSCIELKEDPCGFWYPVVDRDRCIDCHLCEAVCPIIDKDGLEASSAIQTFAAWTKNDSLRYHSTSGGIFSELAYAVLSQGGCVVGAAYDENNMIAHEMVFDAAGVERLRQSKYAQSRTGDIYKEIKTQLKDRKVLFCGCPCQVCGLRKYLNQEYDNLITIDFICRGVNSPKAYRAWLDEIEKKYRSKVKRVWFKYKEDGWKKSPRCTRVDLEDGTAVVQKGSRNAYMCGYLGPNLYIRPSCGDCKFKGTSRYSDITVGDFWGVAGALDDDRGTSYVQVNTPKGKKWLNAVSQRIQLIACSAEDIKGGNICMDGSVSINPRSEEFLSSLSGKTDFSKLVEKYTRRSLKTRLKRFVRRVLG